MCLWPYLTHRKGRKSFFLSRNRGSERGVLMCLVNFSGGEGNLNVHLTKAVPLFSDGGSRRAEGIVCVPTEPDRKPKT